MTWARCEDSYRNRPYSVLTIGDQNYVDDKRYFVSKPQTINKKHVSFIPNVLEEYQKYQKIEFTFRITMNSVL